MQRFCGILGAIGLLIAGSALPAQAQQAPATPTPPAPAASAPAASVPAPEAAGPERRVVVEPRVLMTRDERDQFRQRMAEIRSPEERRTLYQQKRAELAQRAAQRGWVLAEKGQKPRGNYDGERRAEAGGNNNPGWRGEAPNRPAAPPRAP